MKINLDYYDLSSKILVFSGSELARCLKQMLPDSLISINNQTLDTDLTISLTVSDEKNTDNDSFHICIENKHGFITGNNERSVLLGVYHYLHSLGCRFLAPGKHGEILPHICSDSLFMHDKKEASFAHRGVCIEGANSLENVLDFIDWLPKVGYNSFFLQFKIPYTFLARWYHHEKNPFKNPEPFSMEDAVSCMHIIEDAMKQRGLMLHKTGHGWTGDVLGISTVEWSENHKPLTTEQAEITAQINGCRHLFHNTPANTNLCYSNQKAADAFVHLIVDYASKHLGVDYLHVWLADECNNVCECENCKKTTLSDQYVHLLNQIDKELTKKGLKTKLVFLLYQELLWPPVKQKLNHPERFVLMFAPISRTFEASYDLKKSDKPIPVYQRNHITLPVNLTENLNFLREWQQLFHGDSFIYDYPLGRAHYGDLGYVHISKIISEDIKKLHRMGLNGYISCQELRVSLPNALPNYIMGYTLFDDNADAEKLTMEYYQAAYGKDASLVFQYLSRISTLCSCDYFNGIGARINCKISGHMSELLQTVADFTPVLDSHRQSDGQWENLFWKLLDYHRQYTLRLGKALFYLAEGNSKKAQEDWAQFRQFICEKEPEFQEFLDVYRILEVSTKYTRFLPKENCNPNL